MIMETRHEQHSEASSGQMESAVAAEQAQLDLAMARVDQLRSLLADRAGLETGFVTHHQMREEHNAMMAHTLARLADLERVESRLVFGRIDTEKGGVFRIGRLGVSDEAQNPLVIDWRAPVAEAFYQATPSEPAGLRRRRHIRCSGRSVVRIADDVFDRELLNESVLSPDGVLMEALESERTGQLGDIVATIQADQDRIMRSDGDGLLIVEGAPGTGKTVVALHRAAYLLYRRREQLARKGILVVGPNHRFVRYIDDVLPALGETQMVLATVGNLYPGVDTEASDPDTLATLKGDLRMVELIARAVAGRVKLPGEGLDVDVNGDIVHLPVKVLRRAMRLARDVEEQHNSAREPFLLQVMSEVVDRLVIGRGLEEDDPFVRAELYAELRETASVRRSLNSCWMPVTPEKLFGRYLSDPAELRRCGEGLLTGVEIARLNRAAGTWVRGEWTVSDVALLDEAAELLGAAPVRMVGEHLPVEEDVDPLDDLASRAAGDREWVYGHLIVDEAQELTPMEWRMLLRRVPSRSATVVGDIAQRSRAGAVGDWQGVMAMFRGGRREQLTVNYRTPAQVMDLAEAILCAYGSRPVGRVVRSVRQVSGSVEILEGFDALGAVLATPPQRGTAAVIAPGDVLEGLTTHPSWSRIRPDEVKGLEFDQVVVVEPARILSEDGLSSLYVALTRPTQKLFVFAEHGLPVGFPTTGQESQ
jgi:DNA helicase IV